jgi:bifunctional non-homologous end joining protein LigD
MADSSLKTYRGKRDFDRTPEPQGAEAAEEGNRFVVHKHSATADHYDLRLEFGGVLKSWAVPKGPSLNPDDKRFAVETEDHPLEYIDFEGVIPEGEYGGGPMIVWDQGTWAPMDDVEKSLKSGAFKFRLVGEKLKGGWMLARLKKKPGETEQGWLLIKEHDLAVDRENDVLVERPESVKSGRRIEELVAPKVEAKPVALRPGKLKGAVKAPMPASLAPQLATSVAAPPKDDKNRKWLHEIKLDGYRTMAFVENGAVRLVTRSGLDWTRRYGDLSQAFAQLGCKNAVIDGEIVVLDEKGISSFAALQDALANKTSHMLIYYAFDLVHLDGWDLTKVRLADRKGLLAQLLAGHLTGRSAIQLSDHIEGDPSELHERVSEMGLEGLVSKRADAPYASGRTDTWQKIKALDVEEFSIAGYTRSPAGGLGALAVGEWVDGELHYRGKVGTGFDAEELHSLLARLEPMEEGGEPLAGGPKEIRWVRPVLTVRVHYANRTTDGRLRHAVYHGLREAELSRPVAPRKRLISDADLAGIWVTNPTRRMFGKSGPTKLDIAIYYAAVGDFMLPHLFNRPVSLVRCPTGKPQDCFFQRHAFTGMPPTVEAFETKNSQGEKQTYLTVEGVKGYLALAQFGVVEFHSWGTHRRHLDQPDQIVLDLDPGEGIEWREVVEAAVHIRGELEVLGLEPFVKTSGGRGLHVVLPLVPKLDWKQTHKAAGALAKRLADTAPDTFTTVMGASNRKRRIFIDFHRNARSATAAAAYSLRARVHLPASAPLHWADLESIDDPSDLNYSSLPSLLSTSGDPWAQIDDFAREIPEEVKGQV